MIKFPIEYRNKPNVTKFFGGETTSATLFFLWIWYRDLHPKKSTINHEHIHWRQEVELLFVGQWLLAALSWAWNKWRFRKVKDKKLRKWLIYRRNIVEIEAHENHENLNYLNERKRFAWWKYLVREVKNRKKIINEFTTSQ